MKRAINTVVGDKHCLLIQCDEVQESGGYSQQAQLNGEPDRQKDTGLGRNYYLISEKSINE